VCPVRVSIPKLLAKIAYHIHSIMEVVLTVTKLVLQTNARHVQGFSSSMESVCFVWD
jgi:hypothetical protein